MHFNMAKVKKTDLKAIQNRNRVNFSRRLKLILENENRSTSNNYQNQNFDTHDSNQEQKNNETIASTERLRRWVLKYNISKRAVSDLMNI